MKKIEDNDYRNDYKFNKYTYRKYPKGYIFNKIGTMTQFLYERIEQLQSCLNELKEVKDLIGGQGVQIYLIKDNNLEYGFFDSEGKNYEYRTINDKPILIDENFNLYEIVEYMDLNDLRKDTKRETSWIDKIVRVKIIKNSQ